MEFRRQQLLMVVAATALGLSGAVNAETGDARTDMTTGATVNKSDGAMRSDRNVKVDYKNHDDGKVCHMTKADKLIGADVRNLQDKKIGDVKDVILDTGDGRIAFLVLDDGGFLNSGLAHRSVAV